MSEPRRDSALPLGLTLILFLLCAGLWSLAVAPFLVLGIVSAEQRRTRWFAAATEPMRMSRLRTWASSWARTPRSSSQSQICKMPWVTATAACSGLRPVANALGCRSGLT